MSPITGPVATAIAFALAVALGVASHNWELREAHLEARIVQLTEAADHVQTSLRTELAACRAQGGGSGNAGEGRVVVAEAGGKATPRTADPSGARRLLEERPEGIDACARMESADRAVLSNLKK
jgi:hypothetical protein